MITTSSKKNVSPNVRDKSIKKFRDSINLKNRQ